MSPWPSRACAAPGKAAADRQVAATTGRRQHNPSSMSIATPRGARRAARAHLRLCTSARRQARRASYRRVPRATLRAAGSRPTAATEAWLPIAGGRCSTPRTTTRRASASPACRGAPRVCQLLEDAEEDLTAFYDFPGEHWSKLRSTHPLERVNKEIGGCTDVAGIFPNDASAMRLVGPLLIEQNDEWIVTRRQLSVESVTLILDAARSGGEHARTTTKKGGRRPQRRPRDDRPNDRAGALHTSDGLTISIR